jgi:hypothetical protein
MRKEETNRAKNSVSDEVQSGFWDRAFMSVGRHCCSNRLRLGMCQHVTTRRKRRADRWRFCARSARRHWGVSQGVEQSSSLM